MSMSMVDALHDHYGSFEEYRRARQRQPAYDIQPGTLKGAVRRRLLDGQTITAIVAITGAPRSSVLKIRRELIEEGHTLEDLTRSYPTKRAKPRRRPRLPARDDILARLPAVVTNRLSEAAAAHGTNANGIAEAILRAVVEDNLIDAVLEQ